MAERKQKAQAETRKATISIKVIRKDGRVEHYPNHAVTDILVKNLPKSVQKIIKNKKKNA